MSKSAKIRLDQLLVDRGLADSRTKAQALIMAGLVFGTDRRLDKPGAQIAEDTEIMVKGKDHPWVSRGGMKLAKGLDFFSIDPTGLICLDLGASTGGFTDVLLTNGAAKVYAIDVGQGQLDWKLRTDDRVVVLEKTNARHLTADQVPDPIDLIVCDVSFIGLEKVLPPTMALAKPGARLVALIKPQFQAGPGQVGKGGVVRDPAVHQAVCDEVQAFVANDCGWTVLGITPSPIKGPEGNIEFLIGAVKP
ncbi:MAG TPA: TlyA family rRNA (cytidine-2'-O)-methyltransferase [Rhodospirillaceae bacterium]|nr:TlyA family rRNA (cytidine-2'-O)-methyltransferase [Rhodospirillaceae bacterium]